MANNESIFQFPAKSIDNGKCAECVCNCVQICLFEMKTSDVRICVFAVSCVEHLHLYGNVRYKRRTHTNASATSMH